MAKKKTTSRNIVIQHNRLVNSRHILNASEQKLYLAMVSQIKQEDKGFHNYKIDIKDFVEMTGTRHKDEYARAEEITKTLIKKYVEITLPNGDKLQTTFLSHAKYKTGCGYVEVAFSPELKPYLLELKNNFTKYDIRNILPLKSKYAIRIFELLKQFKTIGERIFPVDELMTLLEIPDSYSYGRLKKYILIPTQKELSEHTDMYFGFEEIKFGRKVTSLRFIIHKQKMDLSTRSSPKLEIIKPIKDGNLEDTKHFAPLYNILEAGITQRYGANTYKSWFSAIEIVPNGNVIEIYLPNQFFINYIADEYLEDLKHIFIGSEIELKLNANLAKDVIN